MVKSITIMVVLFIMNYNYGYSQPVKITDDDVYKAVYKITHPGIGGECIDLEGNAAEVLPYFIKYMKSSDERVKQWVIRLARKAKTPLAFDVLVACINDSENYIREEAILTIFHNFERD